MPSTCQRDFQGIKKRTGRAGFTVLLRTWIGTQNQRPKRIGHHRIKYTYVKESHPQNLGIINHHFRRRVIAMTFLREMWLKIIDTLLEVWQEIINTPIDSEGIFWLLVLVLVCVGIVAGIISIRFFGGEK
jgi:hypothetical protein